MPVTLAGEVIEPIVVGLDPVPVDTGDTARTELDRVRPLTDELAAWGGVYERWRAHPLAAERPAARSLNDADHELVRRLGGAEFGRLGAAARRLATVGAAGDALAAAAGATGARLAQAWPGSDGAAAVQRWDAMRSAAAEHGAAARQVGSRLAEATVAARGELRVGVRRALDGAEGFQDMHSRTGADPYDWLGEIDQLERSTDGQHRRGRDRLARIRAQLDDMSARYARVITLLRGSLDAAADGVRRAWDQLELDLRHVDTDPYRRLVVPSPAPNVPPDPRRRPPGDSPVVSGWPPAPLPAEPTNQPQPAPHVEPAAIRAALDPPVGDIATPVTSATRSPSGNDLGGPVLGDTEGRHAEHTGEVRVPQLPDGSAGSALPWSEPAGVEPAAVQEVDPQHTTGPPALQSLLVEVIAFIAAVLAAFGLTAEPRS